MIKFFCTSLALPGPQTIFEDLPRRSLPASLCFIIKYDSLIQHTKHTEKYCATAPTRDRQGRKMDGRERHINPAGSGLTNRMPEMPSGWKTSNKERNRGRDLHF